METLFYILVACAFALPFVLWKALKSFKTSQIHAITRAADGKETKAHGPATFMAHKCLYFFHESLEQHLKIMFPDCSEDSVVFMAVNDNGKVVSTWIFRGPMELLADVKQRIDTYLSTKPLSALVQ